MTKHAFVLAVLGTLLCAAASGAQTEGQDGSVVVQGQPASARGANAAIDPCALLTKDEIVKQIELSKVPSQLQAFQSKGGVWSVSMVPEPRGASPACEISWRGTIGGDVSSKGAFTVVITTAAWLRGSMTGVKQPKVIPGVGDEAYFVGGSSGPPYARVGDIAIGIENFPDTKQSKSGLDLLRLAVARVKKGSTK